jgi:hypothetical protein
MMPGTPERRSRDYVRHGTIDQIIDRICRYCSRISGPGH